MQEKGERKLAILKLEAESRLAPAIFSTKELVERFRSTKLRKDQILGEIFVRHWLGQGTLPARLESIFNLDEHGPEKEQYLDEIFPSRRELVRLTKKKFDSSALEYSRERIKNYLDCHGVFPLCVDGLEAIAIPFNLDCSGIGSGVLDSSGSELSKWQKYVCGEADLLETDVRAVRIAVPFGELNYEGKSLLLPLELANRKRQNSFLLPHPLTYLATGEVEEGRIRPVNPETLSLKEDLAKTIGATFIGESKQGLFGYVKNQELKAFLDAWERKFEKIAKDPSPSEAFLIHENIDKGMSERTFPNDKAVRYLERCLQSVEQSGDADYLNDAWKLHLSLVAAHNHLGNPSKADFHFAKVERSPDPSSLLPAHIVLRSHKVVTFCEQGDLDKAMEFAENNCRNADRLKLGDRKEKKDARMRAYGSLGGQALMQSGLIDPSKAIEAKQWMEKSLQEATELANENEDSASLKELCQSEGQLAWWHALFDPAEFTEQEKQCLQTLQGRTSEDLAQALQHLQKNSLLARYRILLKDGERTPDPETLEIPDTPSYLRWISGVSLKYRGALIGASGKKERALKDFLDSIEHLERMPGNSPLLQLILVSVCCEAVRSLGIRKRSDKHGFIEMAEDNVGHLARIKFYGLHPACSPRHWAEWIRFLTGEGEAVPNPQLSFVY